MYFGEYITLFSKKMSSDYNSETGIIQDKAPKSGTYGGGYISESVPSGRETPC